VLLLGEWYLALPAEERRGRCACGGGAGGGVGVGFAGEAVVVDESHCERGL
jgi:hypothetical protein